MDQREVEQSKADADHDNRNLHDMCPIPAEATSILLELRALNKNSTVRKEYNEGYGDGIHHAEMICERYIRRRRNVCTKETPWTEDKGPAIHPDAKDIGGGDDFDRYECPHCKLVFKVEVS